MLSRCGFSYLGGPRASLKMPRHCIGVSRGLLRTSSTLGSGWQHRAELGATNECRQLREASKPDTAAESRRNSAHYDRRGSSDLKLRFFCAQSRGEPLWPTRICAKEIEKPSSGNLPLARSLQRGLLARNTEGKFFRGRSLSTPLFLCFGSKLLLAPRCSHLFPRCSLEAF